MFPALTLGSQRQLFTQFSASIPGIIYAFLGTSRHLNVAPEAALSLLLGQAVDDIRHDFSDPNSNEAEAVGLHVATIITLQAGLLSFIFGFFRLGFLDVILSRALLRGFIAAMAVIIMMQVLSYLIFVKLNFVLVSSLCRCWA